MSARPTVTVYGASGSGASGNVPIPAVMSAPIRPDIVKYVCAQVAKNKRQAYAVSRRAGFKHSAESWGTGRAVSRIPRVSGGGTHASGSGAFGNMCRGGHMFAPTKVFRKWHVAVPRKLRRAAVAAAIAATASAPLVTARGHKIDGIAEVPFVVSDSLQAITKTKQALEFLKKVNAYPDYKRVRDSEKIRAGKGKWRGRRYVTRRGPLIVTTDSKNVQRAFRNLPGVDTCSVSQLSPLLLAPGGHIGRFVIWTESAVKELDAIYGTSSDMAAPKKAKFRIPRSIMSNADVTTLVNRGEIQAVLRPKRVQRVKFVQSVNPLRNPGLLSKLNPVLLSLKAANRAKSATKLPNGRETRRRLRLKSVKNPPKVAKAAPKAAAKSK